AVPPTGRGGGRARCPDDRALPADELLHRPLPLQPSPAPEAGSLASSRMDVRTFTVGPFMENSYLVRRDGSDRALFVDPGDEAPKLLGALETLGLTLDAILLTHTHIDHVG